MDYLTDIDPTLKKALESFDNKMHSGKFTLDQVMFVNKHVKELLNKQLAIYRRKHDTKL